MNELHPNVDFKYSERRFNNSNRDTLYHLDVPHTLLNSESFQSLIQQFHRYLQRAAYVKKQELDEKQSGVLGPWKTSDIANMDQTPLEFCFNTKGVTYSSKGEKTVWCCTTGSGQDKHQCTAQLTIFADGIARVE